MRRRLAAVVLAAGMLAAAGCGSDGGDSDGGSENTNTTPTATPTPAPDSGGQNTEEVCSELQDTVEPRQQDLVAAIRDASTAAAQGDEEAIAEATAELDTVVGEITTALRDGAENADDDQLSADLEAFATELETVAGSVAAGEQPDQNALTEAGDAVDEHCGW